MSSNSTSWQHDSPTRVFETVKPNRLFASAMPWCAATIAKSDGLNFKRFRKLHPGGGLRSLHGHGSPALGMNPRS